MSAIVVEDLVKRYAGFTAVQDVSFTAAAGEVTALLGPNGAGKTTTIEILEGFQSPTAGTVRVLGTDPRAGGQAGRAWRARIGLVLQSTSLDAQLTVTEALTLFGGLYPGRRRVGEVLDVIDMAADARTRIGVLRRWRATPLPSWGYFAGRIVATVLLADAAALILVLVGVAMAGLHLTAGAVGGLLLAGSLGALALAAAGTAITPLLTSAQGANPLLTLTYLPLIIFSGGFGGLSGRAGSDRPAVRLGDDVVGREKRLGHGLGILLVDRDRLVHRGDGWGGKQRVDLVDDVHELLAAKLVELLGVDDQGHVLESEDVLRVGEHHVLPASQLRVGGEHVGRVDGPGVKRLVLEAEGQ